jgi:hypothetical protein
MPGRSCGKDIKPWQSRERGAGLKDGFDRNVDSILALRNKPIRQG